ncbi:MAG: radical SAM/SPASM domain protein, ACGX system [Atopobiaceae bacterium]|nr:radical SAM/SPASM domain protein, ACGX system [Atopobiaceae bacterium]
MAPHFPFQWHVTDTCDQRCKHCYIFAEGAPPVVTIPLETCKRVVDQMQELCARIGREPYVYLTGGNPILHPDFWRIMELLHERGIRIAIMGNPFRLTPEVCARMRDLGCVKYQVSLDGLRETHDAFRKPGSFDATLAAIPVIRGTGMWANVMTTVSSKNASEVPELIALMAELDVDVYAFGRYCPTSGQRAEEFHMEPLEYRALLVECQSRMRAQRERGARTLYYPKDHLWKLLEWEQGAFVPPAGGDPHAVHDGCHLGRGYLTILPTGAVYACRRMASPAGDVSRETLSDIYFGERLAAYRDITRFEKCTSCPLHGWCRGCPAVAFGYSGDRHAPDPQCWYNPNERRQ